MRINPLDELRPRNENKEIQKQMTRIVFATRVAKPKTTTDVFMQACRINKSLGTYVAARYLHKRAVSIETALYLLTRRK
jgi:hypothetical protein